MEVYLEVTYFINGLIVLFTFELLCYLLNIQMNKKELFKYVLTYNISIIFLYIDFFDGFLLLYDFVLTLFYFRKATYIYYPLYLFIYISLLSFIQYMLPHSTLFQCVLLVEGFDFISMLIVSLLCLCIFYFYLTLCQKKIHENEFVTVTFLNQSCTGFVDNGNKVFYKGYPVIFISQDLLGEYQKIDTIMIETANQKEMVDMTILEEICINQHILHHVYVGVMSSNIYECILNTQLLGGLL